MRNVILTLALVAVPLGAAAQGTPAPTAFPDGAEVASAAQLRERIADKVMHVQLADGSSFRIDYRGNGYAYLDTSSGFRDTGKWRAEDGKLCYEWRRAPSSCGEVKFKGDAIYVKRTNGDVVALTPG